MADRIRRRPVETSAKRVRVYFGGRAIADTTRARLVWEVPYYPTYYVPSADVLPGTLERDQHLEGTAHPRLGRPVHFYVTAGSRRVENAALCYEDSPVEELRNLIRFDWQAMDAWFEEDEEVFVHARDPYTRVDVLDSSRPVRVEIDGVTLAESSSSRFLFETGLPPRYYLPKTSVRMDLLTPTETETACPYKGRARYWTATVDGRVHTDVAWSYPTPLRETERIAGLVCFYNERVDLYVDDRLQERPVTKFA